MKREPNPEIAELLPAVYEELRRLASSYLRRERDAQSIQPTALVHEVYLRLLKDKPMLFQNRAHFCAIAATAMRRILVERARARHALKRGGIAKPTAIDDVHRRVMEITADPLPYGIEPNRKVLEELISHALAQHIIAEPVRVEDLFAPATRHLVA